MERLLTREEREADQDADQVGSATAETVRVVGFHARREAAIRERKLEPEPGARIPGVRVIRGEELEWVGRFDPVRYLGFLTIGPPGLSQIRYGPQEPVLTGLTIVTRQWLTRRFDGES